MVEDSVHPENVRTTQGAEDCELFLTPEQAEIFWNVFRGICKRLSQQEFLLFSIMMQQESPRPTQQELGHRFGVTQGRVSQMLGSIRKKLDQEFHVQIEQVRKYTNP